MSLYTKAKRHHKAGRITAAIDLYQRAITGGDHQPEAAIALAGILAEEGCESASMLAYVYQRHPEHEGLTFALGVRSAEIGDLDTALTLLNKIPDYPGVTVELAKVEADRGNVTEARIKELEAMPKTGETQNLIGACIMEMGDSAKAREYFTEAVRLEPTASAYSNLGNSCFGAQDLERAEEYYQKALKIIPSFPPAQAGLCGVYEKQGEYEKARLSLPKGSTGAGCLARANFYYSQKDYDKSAQEAKQGLRCDSDPTNHRRLLFARGRALDKTGDYEAAFEAYKKGNDLKHITFNRERYHGIITGIIEMFDHIGPAYESDESPIFIIGTPRSGTTLTEQIIASHSEITGVGESRAMSQAVPSVGSVADLNEKALRLACERYLSELGVQGRTVDKKPSNFMFVGLIKMMSPNAKIIHCTREPIDACLSIYFQDFIGRHEYAYSQSDIVFFYQCYQDIMRHWNGLGLEMFENSYEEMVANPDGQITKLLDFCNLSHEELCYKPHTSGRITHTASYQQVREPIYKTSSGRWENYRPWVGEMYSGLYG